MGGKIITLREIELESRAVAMACLSPEQIRGHYSDICVKVSSEIDAKLP